MRQPHAFRPTISDILEDRLVLSHAAAHVATSITPFQAIDTTSIQVQINNAVSAFATDYAQAQSSYFNAVAANPAATNTELASFTASRIGSLVQQLNLYMSAIPGATPTSSGYITGALSGTNPGSLQQQLQSITPVGTNGQTVPQYAQQTASMIQNAAQVMHGSFVTFANLANLEHYSQYAAQHTTPSTKRLNLAQKYHLKLMANENAAVTQAFTNYFNSLNSARTRTLLVPPITTAIASSGTTSSNSPNFSGNIGAYTSQIANATNSLYSSLASAIGSQSRGFNSLLPSIGQSMFANNGLFSQLSGFQIPTDINGLSSQAFSNNVFNMVNTAYQDVIGRVNMFNTNPNFNFSANNSFGNNSFSPNVGTNGFFTGPSANATGLTSNRLNPFPNLGGNNAGFGLAGFNAFNGNFTLPNPTNAFTNASGLTVGFGSGPNTNASGLGFGSSSGGSTNATGLTTTTGTYGNGLRTF